MNLRPLGVTWADAYYRMSPATWEQLAAVVDALSRTPSDAPPTTMQEV